jgi:RimJ/RimL family protein N-acetyltransferase
MTDGSTPSKKPEHSVTVDGDVIRTRRLTLRPWRLEDTSSALDVFSDAEVTRWMAPALTTISTLTEMERLLSTWLNEAESLDVPQGRWAVVENSTGGLVGGAALLLLPPFGVDLEVGWQLGRQHWGQGFATEAGHAVAHQAFLQGEDEIFAVVRPNNRRGSATAQRVGMEWVGETDKYYNLRLEVYRIRSGDLDIGPTAPSRTARRP